jgi:L-arabinokinase
MNPIAYYITAHGYGHGTRSCDVLQALHRLAPHQPVVVTTDLPPDFLSSRLAGCNNLTLRPGAFDVGLIQTDSIRSDLSQTLIALEELYRREESLIEQERHFLTRIGAAVVVADIPALPLAAAQRAGLPDIAIGNFSWDWIYEAYAGSNPRWSFFAEKFRTVYQKTHQLLRLPFSPPMEQFPCRSDIPLLATPGTARRELLAAQSNADPNKHWVLLSFTALDLTSQALENIRALSGEYAFFCVRPLHFPGSCIHSIDRQHIGFADTLASCDTVISKPGFGLVSECIVNRKPLIYADRSDFAEYPYLVEGIETFLRNVHMPADDLYAGDFFQSLEKIRSAPAPVGQIAGGGAEKIAKTLLDLSNSTPIR